MGFKQDIIDKVKGILDENFESEEVSYVPNMENSKLTFGNKGLKFDSTVLFIDMRGSTDILNKHNKSVVAKIHMSYFHTIVKIAKITGGEVRSFNGDSMLVFYQGTTKDTLSNAVMAAMKMKYMLSNSEGGINNLLTKYTPVDFGIGIDDGIVLSTKIGIGGDSTTKDLIWIGNSINKSVVISDRRSSPNHIGISSRVYENLNDDVKYHIEKDYWGNEQKIDMWTRESFEYNGTSEYCYYTTYHWSVL